MKNLIYSYTTRVPRIPVYIHMSDYNMFYVWKKLVNAITI